MTASAARRAEESRSVIREDGWLLALATLLLALGPGTVWYALAQRSPSPLAPLLGIVMALPLAGPLLGRVTRVRIDGVLLGATWALTALGLMVIARVRPALLDRQAAWVIVGWVAFAAVIWFPRLPTLVARYRAAWFGISVLLVLATLVVGQDPGESGHRLWLGAGPFLFQPSEALRVATVILLAGLLSDAPSMVDSAQPTGVPDEALRVPLLAVASVAALSIGAVVLQGDLGPAVLLAGSLVVMLYLAGARARDVAGAIGVLAVGAIVVGLASSRAHERVAIWLDPWSSSEGLGYQALQAIGGLASGDVLGAGPAGGVPTLIPAAHTDYPFAVIGEEWGLLGTLAYLALYALLTVRGLQLVPNAPGRFARLLAAGLVVSFGLQVLIPTAGTLRLIPLTGVTSPFVSYGGSSTLMSWVALGLIVRLTQPPGRAVPRSAGTSGGPAT